MQYSNRLIALDPGGQTGCAIFYFDEKRAILHKTETFPMWEGLLNIETWKGETNVVYENYYIVNVKHNAYQPLITIGAIQLWAHLNNYNIFCQTPGERVFVEKRWDTPYPRIKNHERSAVLHGMCWLYKQRGILTYD
jgi:hypothetical protein